MSTLTLTIDADMLDMLEALHAAEGALQDRRYSLLMGARRDEAAAARAKGHAALMLRLARALADAPETEAA